MAVWPRYERFAIDEAGYAPPAYWVGELLFQVSTDPAEKASVIMTTNLT